jgi:hypothetical protein
MPISLAGAVRFLGAHGAYREHDDGHSSSRHDLGGSHSDSDYEYQACQRSTSESAKQEDSCALLPLIGKLQEPNSDHDECGGEQWEE